MYIIIVVFLLQLESLLLFFFFFQAEDGIRDFHVTGVQTCALPISYRCTDVIAESSFVCEYYLRNRGLEGRFALTPATEIDSMFQSQKIDLAVNIHSFSECTMQAVDWWLGRLASNRVKHLMIVPNAGNHCGQFLRNNIGEDMLPMVEGYGYRQVARDAKYRDPKVQKFGLNPT